MGNNTEYALRVIRHFFSRTLVYTSTLTYCMMWGWAAFMRDKGVDPDFGFVALASFALGTGIAAPRLQMFKGTWSMVPLYGLYSAGNALLALVPSLAVLGAYTGVWHVWPAVIATFGGTLAVVYVSRVISSHNLAIVRKNSEELLKNLLKQTFDEVNATQPDDGEE